MADKLQDYKDRHKDWTDISLSQLSTTNNLLITISTGLLVYCFDKETFRKIIINTSQSIIWSHFFYVASIGALTISIAYGIGVLFSRLYDFRISRHITLVRKRVFEDHAEATLPDDDLGEFNFCHRIVAIFQIIFIKLPFINKTDLIDYKTGGQVTKDFNKLRRISKILGLATWRWTKIQVLLFFLAILCYVIHFWTI